MFPNAQSALPLPQSPNLGRYRKIAKELVKACWAASVAESGRKPVWAEDWARSWIDGLARLSGIELTPELPARVERWIEQVAGFAQRQMRESSSSEGERSCALTRAQFVLARSHGFASWPKFAQHLEALSAAGSQEARFEAAADAIAGGNIAALRRLLAEEPELVRARSAREHGATLLHYVAANGVEGYRQRTPGNVVAIAAMLLEAGAAVDATTHVYGAECTTLGLAATSGHPERAGVVEELLDLLLEAGAAIAEGLVAACLANGRGRAAECRARGGGGGGGDRGMDRGMRLGLVEAVALGRRDLAAGCFDEAGKPMGVTEAELRQGFLFACQFGRDAVVEFLLARGADLRWADAQGQTGLHHAVIGGRPATVRMLLGYGPPLEIENAYGGTPLGQALWSAAHGGDAVVYLEILKALAGAGARLPERHVPVGAEIDAWLAERGSRAEPEWYWQGERPSPERKRSV